ncbi:uncharacterized protein MEPE_06157 [Melanopsichium pennsylvanicum]|uniref:Uncharacterized protein n=2 Tax=Melanopsichium pennsylvanicum TaxID=63383 RepID=A0AAJ4XT74_9BASI|nr:conserved hypothetical protein [Melanopsichium pennsylvanicum 4]SNX87447.1 uncharacterized protein MEPE_06157 [Melanopsichium pennsylvanicum]
MSLLRTSTNFFSSVRAATVSGGRMLSTSTVRRTDDPNILNKETHSGASVKADKHDKDPKTLQHETAAAHNQSGQSSPDTASPDQAPTNSEAAVHGEKHSKSPQQLQKETVGKLHK